MGFVAAFLAVSDGNASPNEVTWLSGTHTHVSLTHLR